MDDGRHIYLWCGPSVDQTLLEDLTGSPAFHLIDPLKVTTHSLPAKHSFLPCASGIHVQVTLEPRENERSQRVWEIIRALRARTPQEQVVQLALPRSRAELQFFAGLVEDKSQQGMSYVDFLCHLHKHIQTKISGYARSYFISPSSLSVLLPLHRLSRNDSHTLSRLYRDETSQAAMRAMVEWS